MHTYTHTCTHGYRCMYLPTYTQIENLSKRRMDTLTDITPCSEAYTKMCVRMPQDISAHIRAQPRQRGYNMGLCMLYPLQPRHRLTCQCTAAKTYNLSTTVHTHTNTHVRTCIRISIHSIICTGAKLIHPIHGLSALVCLPTRNRCSSAVPPKSTSTQVLQQAGYTPQLLRP